MPPTPAARTDSPHCSGARYRHRPPEAASTDEDDAFFDFLRGALEDHEPLGPRGDEGGQTSS